MAAGATRRAARACAPPARRARRSSRCTTARPAAPRRPGGSSRHGRSHSIEPSARTLACQRRLASVSIVPGAISPLSTSRPNATRGAERLSAMTVIALSSSGSVEAIRSRATFDIIRLALDPDPAPPQPPRHRAGRAGAEEGVEHDVARLGAGEQDPVEQGLGLLGRMRLVAVVVLDPLGARADRQHPVRAHLQIVVERLHRAIVEGVARLLVLGAPDQRLVGVGEAGAAEVRHRVRLAPDDVVEDPDSRRPAAARRRG